MSRQRTLLPYRLERDRLVEEILDELAWRESNADVEALLDKLTRWEQPAASAKNLRHELCQLMNEDIASNFVRDLEEACRQVWVVEREFLFPQAFLSLVPMEEKAEVAA